MRPNRAGNATLLSVSIRDMPPNPVSLVLSVAMTEFCPNGLENHTVKYFAWILVIV